MTPDQEPPAPEPLLRGRYALFDAAHGSMVIARTDGLCDRCQNCGCGEKVDPPIEVPPMVVALGKAAMAGEDLPGPLGALFKGMQKRAEKKARKAAVNA